MSAANDNRLAYGVGDAAQMMSVSKSTVWRWIHEGKLVTIQIGGRTLIRRGALLRLLREAA